MSNSFVPTRDVFLACDWKYEPVVDEHHGYSSVMSALQKSARMEEEAGFPERVQVLQLLGRAASMRLVPESINEPFKALIQDFQAGRRSAQLEDFTLEEVNFFEEILADVSEPWLKARLADVVWLLRKPKRPHHAKIAIDSYISHEVDSDTWHRDVNDCWERAARLSIQIKDEDRLREIESRLFSAFCSEYPRSKYMSLWIADLLDKVRLDRGYLQDISASLRKSADELKLGKDFGSARSYYELAAKKFQQCSDETGWLESIIEIANCFELEADVRSGDSNMIANSFYQNSIQAYRRVPVKNREVYSIEDRIARVRAKITTSGKASLGEMSLIETPGVDISDMVSASVNHVSGKRTLEEALICFSGLSAGLSYVDLAASAKESMSQSIISSMFGSSHMSSDGRVIAKTPPVNLSAGEDDPANAAVLLRQIQLQFSIKVQFVVAGKILPAVRQLQREHRVTREFIEALCHHSPIVPQNRVRLLGLALWLGFEHEFGAAIHLLCPQVEHIVRTLLKEAGAVTSNIDREGIENENGLSTLMDLPEASVVFGPDLTFEIKSVFTEALGFNLRNEVAHGVLDDDSSSSIHAVYAWWMIIRLLIDSIIRGSIRNRNDAASE